MNTKKGYIGLIILIAGVVFILFWFVYLWDNNWYSGKLNIPDNALNGNAFVEANQSSKGINDQLNDLRQDVKALQDRKDQEILNELNK